MRPRQIGRFWFPDWSVGWFPDWSVSWLVLPIGQLVSRLVSQLVGFPNWSVGWFPKHGFLSQKFCFILF